MDHKEAKYIPTRGMLNVRILAGVYLLYLVYRMYQGLASSAGTERLFMIAAVIVFLVIGALLIVFSALSLKKGRYAGGAMFPDPESLQSRAEKDTQEK